MKKDMLVNLGGAFAIGALIFGVGLMAIGSKKAPAGDNAPVIEGGDEKKTAEAEPKSEDQKDKKDEGKKDEAKKEEGKGEEKAGEKSEGKGEEKQEGGEAKPEKKDEKKEEKKEEKKLTPEEEKKLAEKKEKEHNRDLDELQELQVHYNDLSTRGNFDDARLTAMKALNLGGRDDANWVRRLADATYQAEALPAQLRYQKAYDSYGALLTSNLSAADKEWAQYRAALCLTHLGRWEDAQQAMDQFVKAYPDSARIQEVRLQRAQSMFALGRPDDARDELEYLVKHPAARDVHASALVELARVELDRAKHEDTKGLARAEVLDLGEIGPEKPAPVPVKAIAPVPANEGVPDAQWASVRRAIEKGNLIESQRLLSPWISEGSGLSSEERARVSLKYAELLRQVAQSHTKEDHK